MRSAAAWAGPLALLGACAPAAAGQAGFERLADEYRRAHAARDVDAVVALTHQPPGGTSLDTVREMAAVDVQQPVASVTLEPLAADERLEYTIRGVTYRPSARPVGRMRVKLARPARLGDGFTTDSTSYLVGLVDGRYRLLGDAPVAR